MDSNLACRWDLLDVDGKILEDLVKIQSHLVSLGQGLVSAGERWFQGAPAAG